jgi:hypothetical protein
MSVVAAILSLLYIASAAVTTVFGIDRYCVCNLPLRATDTLVGINVVTEGVNKRLDDDDGATAAGADVDADDCTSR